MLNNSFAVKVILPAVFAFPLSQAAMADFVIKKVNASGFVQPEKMRQEVFEVRMNATEIATTYGAIPNYKVKTVRIVSESLSSGVQDVLKGSFESELIRTPNNRCGAPSTNITAVYNGEEFTVFSTGGCGSDGLNRYDTSSEILMEIVKNHCPKVYNTNQE